MAPRSRRLARAAWIVALVLGLPLLVWAGGRALDAHERACWRRTAMALRTLGTAVELYDIDHLAYPDCATVEELAMSLVPTYIDEAEFQDGWGRPLHYRAWRADGDALVPGPPDEYVLWSAGPDGLTGHLDPAAALAGSGDGHTERRQALRNLAERLTRWD